MTTTAKTSARTTRPRAAGAVRLGPPARADAGQDVIGPAGPGAIRVRTERPHSPDGFVACRVRVREALARLGEAGSTQFIRASAARELAHACGFTRAMLSAVRGSRWVPHDLYTSDELDPEAAQLRAYVEGGNEIPLAHLLPETDMVRRAAAVLIDESLVRSRAFKPIVAVAQSTAYVAAPLLAAGRTIGFLHADRVGQARPVDDDDRRHIQAFAGGLAVAYQCAGWGERLAERGERAAGELERAARELRMMGSAVACPVIAPDDPRAARPYAEGGGRDSRAFLTAREREILDHVADGATNRGIAQRLSVSEDTVKTHMRSVLRKLRVTTRAAAVARYLEIRRGAA